MKKIEKQIQQLETQILETSKRQIKELEKSIEAEYAA